MISYNVTVKNSRLTVVRDAIDSGASGGGSLVLLDASAGVLARIDLDNTCGTVSAGVLTFSGLPNSGVAIGTGVATMARIEDAAGNTVASGLTVGGASESPTQDVVLDSTSISIGQTVTLNSASITHAP